MKKVLIEAVILAVVIVFMVNIIIMDLKKANKQTYDKYYPYVGKRVILDKDTTTIIDYSMMLNEYELSKGISVNADLVLEGKLKTIE